MVRLCLTALLISSCFAQAPADLFHKAPPDVDQALRARVSEFFQDHIDGKYRQAEKLVAEESKDFFYSSNKPKYLSFEIRGIEYDDNFAQAKVTVLCEMYVAIPGFAGKPLKVPTPSTWKVVDGQWYWYVDQSQLSQTPFGRMKASAKGGTSTAELPSLAKQTDPNAVLGKVRVDKHEVRLKAEPGSSDKVTIFNDMPGSVSFSIGGPRLELVELRLEPPQLKSGEKGSLSFRLKSVQKTAVRPATIELRVEQTNQVIPIRVVCLPPSTPGS